MSSQRGRALTWVLLALVVVAAVDCAIMFPILNAPPMYTGRTTLMERPPQHGAAQSTGGAREEVHLRTLASLAASNTVLQRSVDELATMNQQSTRTHWRTSESRGRAWHAVDRG